MSYPNTAIALYCPHNNAVLTCRQHSFVIEEGSPVSALGNPSKWFPLYDSVLSQTIYESVGTYHLGFLTPLLIEATYHFLDFLRYLASNSHEFNHLLAASKSSVALSSQYGA